MMLVVQTFIETLPNNAIYATASTLGIKFFIAIIFFMVQLQCMEIYPTCLRQTGISVASTVANAIGAAGPYVVFLVKLIEISDENFMNVHFFH